MITIKDVAKAAGVSICTVSRVLSNTGYIAPETKKKVLDQAHALGYRPNRLARDLQKGSSDMVGLIVPDITNYFYMELAKEIEKTAREKGFLLSVCNSNGQRDTEETLIASYADHLVKGMIIIPSSGDLSPFAILKDRKIPYVFLNRTFPDELDHCVQEDNEGAASEIITYLLSKGRRCIAGLFPSFDNMIYRQRLEGMKRALLAADVPFDENLIVCNAETPRLEQVLRDLFSNKQKCPDAIFAGNDMLAFGAYHVLYQLGKRIPQEVMVVGFDDTQMAQNIYPQLTSYRMPIDTIAKLAMDKLLHPEEPRHALVVGELKKRQSTGD